MNFGLCIGLCIAVAVLTAEGILDGKQGINMDPSDYPSTLDSAEYITASDPWFGAIVAMIIFGSLAIWLWRASEQD